MTRSLMERPNMKKILQDSDTEGESSTDAQWPQFAKHRHGWINRILRTGRITNEESLLSFKKVCSIAVELLACNH